ncbi:hypothetical protein CH063_10918 [Colletotrichum higginsianum]|uniref:Uncharacterized protein n=1 Tax=Colletotrichum higginsianum (strain IMI 349063) TaxID=759273 RepID=H1VJB6_COLHI|nr:hypothetical protein CH063_10918 [Colletotrichum higginsianum]
MLMTLRTISIRVLRKQVSPPTPSLSHVWTNRADILAREIQDTVTGLTQCQRGERKPLYRPVQDGSLDASRRRVVTHLGREA